MGKRFGTVALVLLLLTGLVAVVPFIAGAAGITDTTQAVDLADAPLTLAPPPPLLTEEQRRPVLDFSDIEGLWPEDIVEVTPGPVQVTSPQDAIAGATALPAEGGPSVDVYAAGPDDTAHLALVDTADENKLNTAGNWKDIKVALTPDPSGWSWIPTWRPRRPPFLRSFPPTPP